MIVDEPYSSIGISIIVDHLLYMCCPALGCKNCYLHFKKYKKDIVL